MRASPHRTAVGAAALLLAALVCFLQWIATSGEEGSPSLRPDPRRAAVEALAGSLPEGADLEAFAEGRARGGLLEVAGALRSDVGLEPVPAGGPEPSPAAARILERLEGARRRYDSARQLADLQHREAPGDRAFAAALESTRIEEAWLLARRDAEIARAEASSRRLDAFEEVLRRREEDR